MERDNRNYFIYFTYIYKLGYNANKLSAEYE